MSEGNVPEIPAEELKPLSRDPEPTRNHDADSGALLGIASIVPFAAWFIIPFGYFFSLRGFSRARREKDERARLRSIWGIALNTATLVVNFFFISFYVPDMLTPVHVQVIEGCTGKNTQLKWDPGHLRMGTYSVTISQDDKVLMEVTPEDTWSVGEGDNKRTMPRISPYLDAAVITIDKPGSYSYEVTQDFLFFSQKSEPAALVMETCNS